MVVIKKKLIKLEEFLEKNPKIKKKFNKEFKKYENRPKPNKKLKIGLKYIKKNFNLNLFLKQIEKYNYKYMDEGDMLDRVIQYGFKQDEVYKIRDHFDNKEYDKLRKLADDYKLLVKITDNFKAIDYMAEKVETETLSKWIEATLLYSQINFTYYLFIDEINFTEQNRGNCLYFKSKNKKLIINKMIKFFDKLKKKYNQGGVMNLKKLSKEFNSKIFLKNIKLFPIKLGASKKKFTNNPTSLIHIENLIAYACGFDEGGDRSLQYGQYEIDSLSYSVQVYKTDFLRNGNIFNKLDNSFEFSPIMTFVGYVDGVEPYQIIISCLYSHQNDTSYITWFDDKSNYFHFYFVKKLSGNLMKKVPLIKSFFKQLLKKNTILYGQESDIKFILINKDLNLKDSELASLFLYAQNERKKLIIYLREDGLASNIIEKEKINYNLNFYTIDSKKNFFFTYDQIFEKDHNYIETKLKKPSIQIKID